MLVGSSQGVPLFLSLSLFQVSAFLLPSLVCGTAFFINFIAIYYHASRAIPFGTMVRERERERGKERGREREREREGEREREREKLLFVCF